MIDDKRIGSEITHYLEDVEDSVGGCMEDLSSVVNLITVMKIEFESANDRRLNNMLGVLTFSTVCILPAQFLTGMYGMNFVDEEGNPSLPELTWKYGYSAFWAMSISSVFLIYFYFHKVLKVM